MKNKLHIDFETRSTVDLKKTGIVVYSEHSTTEVLCMSYKFSNESTKIWFKGEEFPLNIIKHIQDGLIVCAHNAMFELHIFNNCLPKQVNETLPKLSIEQISCTMIRSMCSGLPASLDSVASALNTEVKKDLEGGKLMKKMMKPKKYDMDGNPVWIEDSESMQRLGEYCVIDTDTEYHIDNLIPELSSEETEFWHCDYEMNKLGINLDIDLISKSINLVDYIVISLDKEIQELSDNKISGCKKAKQIKDYLNSLGYNIESLSKENIKSVLNIVKDNDVAYRIVEIYSHANKSSLAKFEVMKETLASDMRSHFVFQYGGAFTGRWSGRLWQPQNLKRVDEDSQGELVRQSVKGILEYDTETAHDLLQMLYGDSGELLSLCMRSTVMARPGFLLVGADYSNIEGRVMAWLAGSELKIKEFEDQDKGGADMYKKAYASSFGIDVKSVTKKQRQIGKTQELALQYQGGISALLAMMSVYGVKPSDISDVVLQICSDEDYSRAEWYYNKTDNHFGLNRDEFMGLQITINRWRNSNLNINIKNFWSALENAFISAFENPGTTFGAGIKGLIAYKYDLDKKIMYCRLPTGKILYYRNPSVSINSYGKKAIFVNQYDTIKKKMIKESLYGGLLGNHVTQGTAAILMKRGMLNIQAGKSIYSTYKGIGNAYEITMTVHDECVAEVSQDSLREEDTIKDFERLLVEVGPEFQGLPLISAGWLDKRYVK